MTKRDKLQEQAEKGKITGREFWDGLKSTWAEMTDKEKEMELTKLSATTLGRKGGKSTSPAKQAASRLNGRKGGRPRKCSGVDILGHCSRENITGRLIKTKRSGREVREYMIDGKPTKVEAWPTEHTKKETP